MPDDEEDVRAVQAIERIINSDPDSAFTRARLAGTTFARPKLLVTAIGEQADLLGIELEKYWWIAARSLLAPLPDKWAQYKDAQEGRLYYLNESSGESSWEHPLDDQYRRMHSRYAEDDAQGVDGWVSPSVHEQSVLAEKRRQDAAYAKLRGDFFTDTSKSAMTFASDEEEEEPPSRRRGGRRSDDARARSDYARSDYARSDASDGDAPRTSRAGRGEYAPQQRRPQHYPDDARYEDDRYEDDRYDDARYDAPPRPPQGGDDYKAYPPRPQQPHDRDPQRSQRDGGQRDGSRDGSQRDGSRDGGQRDGAPRQPAYEQRQRQGRPSEDDEQRKGRPYDADADFDFEDSDARRGYADDAPYSKSDHSNGREAGNGREAARSSGREAWSRRSKAGSPRRDENGRGPAFRDRSYEREARPESPGRRAAKAVLEEAAGGLRRSASLDRPDRTPPNRTGPLQTRPDQQVWDRPGQSPTREPRDEEPAYARTTRVAAPRNEEPAPAPCASSSPASLNAANPGEARSIGVEEALRQEIKALQAEKLAHCERLDAEKERGSKIVAIAERETAAAKRDRDAAVEALQANPTRASTAAASLRQRVETAEQTVSKNEAALQKEAGRVQTESYLAELVRGREDDVAKLGALEHELDRLRDSRKASLAKSAKDEEELSALRASLRGTIDLRDELAAEFDSRQRLLDADGRRRLESGLRQQAVEADKRLEWKLQDQRRQFQDDASRTRSDDEARGRESEARFDDELRKVSEAFDQKLQAQRNEASTKAERSQTVSAGERTELERKLQCALLAGESLQQECDALQSAHGAFANSTSETCTQLKRQLDFSEKRRKTEVGERDAAMSALERQLAADRDMFAGLEIKHDSVVQASEAMVQDCDARRRRDAGEREAALQACRQESLDVSETRMAEAFHEAARREEALRDEFAVTALESRRCAQADAEAQLAALKVRFERSHDAAVKAALSKQREELAGTSSEQFESDLESLQAAHEDQRLKLKAEVDSSRKDLRELRLSADSERDRLRGDVSEAANSAAQLEAARDASVAQLDAQRKAADRRAAASQAAFDGDAATLRADIDRLTRANDAFASAARARSEKAEARAAEALEAEVFARAELDAVGAASSAAQQRALRGEAAAASAKRELQVLKTDLEAQSAHLDEHKTAIKHASDAEAVRRRELDAARAELAEALRQTAAFQQQLESNNRVHSDVDATSMREIARLRLELESVSTKSSRSAGDSERKWALERSALRSDSDGLEVEVAALRSKASDLQAQLCASKSKAENAIAQAGNESQAKLEAVHVQLENVRAALESSKRESAALAKQREGDAVQREVDAKAVSELQMAHALQVSQEQRVILDLGKKLAQVQAELADANDRKIHLDNERARASAAESDFANALAETEALRAQLDPALGVGEEASDLFAKYALERAQRRALHNKLMELQGNIRVIARCRPPAPFETAGGDADVVLFPDAQGELTVRNEAGSPHAFEFDSVFAPGSTQGEVFDAVKPMITSALDGYPSCIFAYGQTGSGKTHTMEGPLEDRGVYFRALAELFEFRDEKGQPLQITLSMLEIYNETIRDLLVLKTGGQPKLEIRQTQTGHNVPGLTQVRVATQDEVTNVVGKGSAQRTVGGHDMNEHSSRSHLIISLDIAGRGKLNLVDLAGSERLSKTNATGDRLKEAQAINKSLSALGDVIQALSKKNGHVPYRNSKLTYLLQDSLSVSAKVMMVVAVSPNESNASETICSLNFASRCRDVALGGKSASIELDKAKKTIRMLQAKLATLTS